MCFLLPSRFQADRLQPAASLPNLGHHHLRTRVETAQLYMDKIHYMLWRLMGRRAASAQTLLVACRCSRAPESFPPLPSCSMAVADGSPSWAQLSRPDWKAINFMGRGWWCMHGISRNNTLRRAGTIFTVMVSLFRVFCAGSMSGRLVSRDDDLWERLTCAEVSTANRDVRWRNEWLQHFSWAYIQLIHLNTGSDACQMSQKQFKTQKSDPRGVNSYMQFFGIYITLRTFYGACLSFCEFHIIPNII